MGDVLIADGYCNSRVAHYSASGEYVGQYELATVSQPACRTCMITLQFRAAHVFAWTPSLGMLMTWRSLPWIPFKFCIRTVGYSYIHFLSFDINLTIDGNRILLTIRFQALRMYGWSHS